MRNFSLMILAAGYGKRMENLTHNTPKPLLKINKTTLLSNAIDFFEKLGCNQFIINTHYLHHQFNNYISSYHANKNIIVIFEPEILDTGGGVKNAIKFFDNKNFLVTNSDIFWNENNRNDIENFIINIDKIENCCLLICNQDNAIGINRSNGDFVFDNNYLRRWRINDPVYFYSGLQILNYNIFNKYNDTQFSMNKVWDNLIIEKKLKGKLMKSSLYHIGNKSIYDKYNSSFSLD